MLELGSPGNGKLCMLINKSYIWHTYKQYYTEYGKPRNISFKIKWYKGINSSHSYSYSDWLLIQIYKAKERYKTVKNKKIRNWNIPICKWHDYIIKRP
jgi:hypothetical protein